jgi:hypothetical protein
VYLIADIGMGINYKTDTDNLPVIFQNTAGTLGEETRKITKKEITCSVKFLPRGSPEGTKENQEKSIVSHSFLKLLSYPGNLREKNIMAGQLSSQSFPGFPQYKFRDLL